MEGSSFFVGTIATGRPTPGYEAPKGASSQGDCSLKGDAVGATAALLRKPLHGAAFVVVTGRGPHRRPQGRRAARSPQAPECGGARRAFARRSYGVLPSCSMEQEGPPRSMRWCQRRLRPGRLGPGSGRSLSKCAPSSEGGRDLLSVDPLRWVESARRRPLMKRSGARVRFQPSFADGSRGSGGDALNKCAPPGRVGNDRLSPDAKPGLVLRDGQPRDRSAACTLFGRRRNRRREGLLPPGCEVFSPCRVSCPPEADSPPRRAGRSRDTVVGSRPTEDTVL